jgi:hypothetical protein
MSGVPRLEFPRGIFLPGLAQFRHDSWILRRQPIVQLVQRFDGREHLFRDFDYFARHGVIVRLAPPKYNSSVVAALWAR